MESGFDSRTSPIKSTLFLYVVFICIGRIGSSEGGQNSTYSNVALHKSTFQSSQYDNTSLSELAVDDNITSCSRTAEQKGASWTVDLGDVFSISQVKISTGGTFFGQNFELYVSNTVNFDGGMLCNYGFTASSPQMEYVISCFSGAVMARVLTIKNVFGSGVQLCDVQVLVCHDGFFGAGCLKSCRCDKGSICDKVSGSCPELCAPGWNGTDCQSACEPGTFGPSCRYQCHCQNGSVCDIHTGNCPDGCAEGWVGPSCRTAIPRLANSPTLFSTGTMQMTIMWHSWISFVDPSIKLLYQVQYQLSFNIHGSHIWTEGPLQVDTDRFNEEANVTGLQRNSFYIFRVVPILRLSTAEEIRGGVSPESTPFRTKCTVPEIPNITLAYSWMDTTRHTPLAVIYVEWIPLTPKQSNCENILYYEIFYQKRGSEWKKTGAKKSEYAKNISSDVSFESEYWVRVVAHNNHPYQSSSDTKIILTPIAPDILVHKESSQNVAIIAGVLVCVGVVFAVVVALIMYRQKMKPSYGKIQQMNAMESRENEYAYLSHMVDDHLVDSNHVILRGDKIKKQRSEVKSLRKHLPIKVEDLENYILSRQANECEELRKEYREIPEGNSTASSSVGEKDVNKPKNRFVNITPYDHSRVVLEIKDNVEDSDYINASYLDGYKKPKAYIASQGCKKHTIQDLWRMVWEQKCYRIVMVTNLIEKGKDKCEQYWPNEINVEKSFNNINVVLKDMEKTADFAIRTLEIRQDKEIRNVKHFHYTTWPDHGVPSRTGPIIAFRRKVRQFDESHPGAIVVHCSAGVGRTGTFVALDYLLDQAENENQVDVFGLTCQMRRNRANMIQTVEQYFFVYNALLEALKSGNTVISCSEFRSAYEMLSRINPSSGKSHVQEQFDLLQSMAEKVKPEIYASGEQPENQDKNRFSSILPDDKHRPYLMTRVKGTNDYINAVFLDGYRSRNAYIITQMPLPVTVIDLWRMIYEHKCGTVVMLNSHDDQNETYGQYWPEENEECECGPFQIEIVAISNPTPDIILRKLKLCYSPNPATSSMAKDSGPRMINHFQLTNWSSDDMLPPSAQSLVALIELVEQSQRKVGNYPVVIHCHDGVTQSGLYAAVSCIWERLKDEQEIDVFQTVKLLRCFRNQIVRDMAQYRFCHEMVLTYLDDFANYSNY